MLNDATHQEQDVRFEIRSGTRVSAVALGKGSLGLGLVSIVLTGVHGACDDMLMVNVEADPIVLSRLAEDLAVVAADLAKPAQTAAEQGAPPDLGRNQPWRKHGIPCLDPLCDRLQCIAARQAEAMGPEAYERLKLAVLGRPHGPDCECVVCQRTPVGAEVGS
jgi:hypothetical protein